MRVNVCVNGTFRYPGYVRHYERAGVLNAFYFAHRPGTTRRKLEVQSAHVRNVWAKEVLLQAAWRTAPSGHLPRLSERLCDLFQSRVIRDWRDCDTVETVIGAVADRVIGHARNRGSRVLGHAVMSHPDRVVRLLARAYSDLGLDPSEARYPDRDRRLAEIGECDRILVDSAAVARSFMAEGVPPSKIATVTPAVDLGRFRPREEHDRHPPRFRVICVGALTPRKGQQVLLRAWRKLRLPGAELILVGLRGRHAAAVVRGFEGGFTHIRSVPQDRLRDLLLQCSVLVAPSVEDGFAQAPLEAMACGLPVIVSDHVGMADLLRDGVSGFIVPAFDADLLAERLERLFRDPALRFAMGKAAANAAAALPGWPAYVERVLAEHRTMLHGEHGA